LFFHILSVYFSRLFVFLIWQLIKSETLSDLARRRRRCRLQRRWQQKLPAVRRGKLGAMGMVAKRLAPKLEIAELIGFPLSLCPESLLEAAAKT